EPFRAGVRRYLEAHANGNATTKDFLAAIGAAAGKDVAPAFASFLDQPGLPAVRIEADCSAGAKLRLAQERFVPAGAHDVPPRRAPPRRWRRPRGRAAGPGRGLAPPPPPPRRAERRGRARRLPRLGRRQRRQRRLLPAALHARRAARARRPRRIARPRREAGA